MRRERRSSVVAVRGVLLRPDAVRGCHEAGLRPDMLSRQ